MRSPHCVFEWAGWSADGYALQRCGWEMKVEQSSTDRHDPFGRRILVALHHRQAGWTGIAEGETRGMLEATMMDRRYAAGGAPPPVFQVRRMANRAQDYVIERNYETPASWSTISMEPVIEQRHRMTLADIFNRPETPEIIVDPATVSDLLDRIKNMQAPELAEIRERNRRRDARDRQEEVVSAQIITLKAA
jgi:hypothetical protein